MKSIVCLALFLQTAQQIKSADTAFHVGYAAMAQGDLVHAHTAFAQVVKLTPQISAGHSAYGAVLLAEGNLAAAVAELEKAHRLDGNDETATMNLAVAYSGLHRFVESASMFHRLAPGTHLTPGGTLAYANSLASTGDLAAATYVLQQAVTTDPADVALHDALGSVLAQQKRYEEAEAEFIKVTTLDARFAPAHFHLGSLYLAQRKLEPAIAELSTAVMLTPNDLQSLLQLGRAQTTARNDEAAVTTLTHAHELSPQSPDSAYALALALQNAGRSKEAIPLFQSAASGRPKDSSILTNYALALVQTGDANKAIPLYQRALVIDATSPVLREDLGVAYLQQSDLDHAIAEFQAGLALPNQGAPLTAELHYDLGLAFKLKDKLPEAIAEFEQAEKQDTTLPDPPFTLGVLYMQTGKFEEAATQLEKATSLQPENGEAWSILGNVYKEMNQPTKAITALRRATELVPAQPSPHISLAAILSQQGDREGAAAERKIGAELSRTAVSRQRSNFALNSGTSLLQEGKIAEAIAKLQDAIAADPGYAAPHRVLADALTRKGSVGDAALERKKAESLEQQK